MPLHPLRLQKMLHRQTPVQPLIPSGQGGGAPPVNPPPVQPNVPVSQPQPVVSTMLIYSCITHLFYNKGPALHPENGSDVTAPMQVLIDFDESDLSGESQ